MGFCLVNNVAVTARALADRGERVLIVDYDAHHGNGTQDVFYDDDAVTYVSFHEYPLYPGTGGVPEMGEGDGWGATINFPFPAGRHRRRLPASASTRWWPRYAASWQPTWLLVSAGFDGHRRDPDHRPRAVGRGLRRPHPGAGPAGRARPPDRSSSRAATTCRAWPTRPGAALAELCGEALPARGRHQRWTRPSTWSTRCVARRRQAGLDG